MSISTVGTSPVGFHSLRTIQAIPGIPTGEPSVQPRDISGSVDQVSPDENQTSSQSKSDTVPSERSVSGETLSEEEKQEVKELKKRDREVRAHEQAHLAAAGGHARGGIKYEFQTGPDGQRYAVGGSVSLDTSEEKDPEDTIQKMQRVRAAALAPAEPSPKDMQVAQKATRKQSEARMELNKEKRSESGGESENQSPGEISGYPEQPGEKNSGSFPNAVSGSVFNNEFSNSVVPGSQFDAVA